MPFHRVQSYVKNRQSMYACTCFIGHEHRFRHAVGLKSDENTPGRLQSTPFLSAPPSMAPYCVLSPIGGTTTFFSRTPSLKRWPSSGAFPRLWAIRSASFKRDRRNWAARREPYIRRAAHGIIFKENAHA